MIRVAIAGGSGYVGGELLRLLLDHPQVSVTQVTSERLAGQRVAAAHPHLRGRTELTYRPLAALERCDALVLALGHGAAARQIERLAGLAERIVDCSADFRLADAASYERWYGEPHAAPAWLGRFVYGLPELHREQLRGARWASGVGCNATATTLALLPLARAGLLDPSRPVVAEVKVGSSEAGAAPGEASHHPARSRAMRSFAPVGHRHTAEVRAATGIADLHLSITAVEAVRGVLATCQAWLRPSSAQPGDIVDERALWRAWRDCYAGEPFVRIVHERGGLHRHPEPRPLAGTNFADVGWALDAASGRVVALCALDNLGKGAAGSAVQCLNLMCGFDERAGLGFGGLYPL